MRFVMNIKKLFLLMSLLPIFTAPAFSAKIESRFGVCCHPVRNYEYPMHVKMFDGVKDCGIKIIRTDMDWGPIDAGGGFYDFVRFDEVFNNALDRGISLLGIMTGVRSSKEWAVNATEKWQNYLTATAAHFKGRVDDWEIINEVDWGDWLKVKYNNNNKELGAAYAKLLKAAYAAVKKGNPDSRVLYSGVALMNGPFIEETFKADPEIGKNFDVMNIHKYYGFELPEYALSDSMKKLKELMAKYNIDKPIWLTETGCNTAPLQQTVVKGIRMALEKLGIGINKDEIAVIFDESENYSSRMYTDWVSQAFPEIKRFKRIKLSEIENLDPKKVKAVLLQSRAIFPRKYLNALLSYIGEGGTIVSPDDIPLARDGILEENGKYMTKSYGNAGAEMLHFKVSTPWEREHNKDFSLPRDFTRGFEAGEGFEDLKPEGVYVSYVISDSLLQENDKMYPILVANHGGKKYTLGALIKYDSVFKGNAIVFAPILKSNGSEEYQGKLLPRYMLTALATGVEKVFNYSYHSNGLVPDAEGHFGISRYDCSYKPAWYSYKTLIEMLGEKSKPVMTFDGNVVLTSWTRAEDGAKVWAVWKLPELKKVKVKFAVKGEIKEMKNWLGKNQRKPKGDSFERFLDSGPLYLVGPEALEITRL